MLSAEVQRPDLRPPDRLPSPLPLYRRLCYILRTAQGGSKTGGNHVMEMYLLKIWAEKKPQMVAFELPQLPGETFQIVIPEMITDTKGPIVPWPQQSPQWDITNTAAAWSVEIQDVVRMEASVVFQGEHIQALVSVTNLSRTTWENANAFTCFRVRYAPSFQGAQLARTYVPVAGEWKSMANLFAEHHPGEGPYTFFRVEGGPALEDLWVCNGYERTPPAHFHPQVVSKGCCCVVSTDGTWIAGMTTQTPAYLFSARNNCIHADPTFGNVAPGDTSEASSIIHIFRGTLQDFTKRCKKTA